MDNLRPAIIAGVCGFVLSLLITLVSGIRLPMLLVRPLIFGAVFFALGAGVIYLFQRFFDALPRDNFGQNVDISVDDDGTDETDMGMDFASFADVGTLHESDDFNEQGIVDIESEPGQNRRGLEQNSTLGYTEDKQSSNDSFEPMRFDVADENEETPRSAPPPSAGGRKVYARVPEMDKIVNAAPKKLASTIQNLLSDE
jgi:hypothetical protein